MKDACGERASAENQTRAHKLVERVPELALRPASDCRQQVVRKLPADCRADLRHLFDRRKPVEARQQRVVQAGRYCQRWQRAGENVPVILFLQQAAFQYRFCQLFDEERDAVGAFDDPIRDLRRQDLAFGQALDQRRRVPRGRDGSMSVT